MTENILLKHSKIITQRYKSHRKWVERNRDKYLKYHRNYNSRQEVLAKRRKLYLLRKEHFKKRDRLHYEKTRDRHRELQISKKYNISVEMYRKMFESQKHLCAICGNREKAKNKVLSVDHNHATKKVRGLLCGNCNRAIGYFQEKIYLLPKIQAYLEYYDKTR